MKNILFGIIAIAGLSVLTSCNKEYSCECDGFSQIIEAPTENEADATCSTLGTNCDAK